MTVLKTPLIAVFPCFCAGLIMGLLFPSEFYLAPTIAVGAFALWASYKSKGFVTDLLILLLCVLIGAQRMSANFQNMEDKTNSTSFIEEKLSRISERLESRLHAAGLRGDEMSLTSALVLGKREGLNSELKTKFRQVGASHLLALSGMHLGVIYGLLCVICIRWVRFSPFRWIALPLLICGLWTYTLLTGMPASLIRASSMLSLVCLGILLFRTPPLLHTLTLSATLMLFANPSLLTDIGFQLSFLAVLFIALAYSPFHSLFHSWPIMVRWPARMLLLSLSAQIGTLPLSAYYFHTLPLSGPIISLILIPITTALIYGGLFTLILPIPLFASFTTLCVQAELWVLDFWMNLFPHSLWDNLHPSPLSVMLIYIAMLAGFTRLYKMSSDTGKTHQSVE